MRYRVVQQCVDHLGVLKETTLAFTFDKDSASRVLESWERKLPSWGYEMKSTENLVRGVKRGNTVDVFYLEYDEKTVSQFTEGTYTVVWGEKDWSTIRFKRQPKDASFAPDSVVVSLLIGADNTENGAWQGYAFYDPLLKKYNPWNRFKNMPGWAKHFRAIDIVVMEPNECAKAYALKSGRCCRCGRKLTVPSSIEMGMGPECAGKEML